jgi:D-tyrosyl-tRNA(Tyr) deacylase
VRAIVQRVKRAQVSVEGRIVGCIERGLLVLLGVAAGDTEADAREIANRVLRMRIFADPDGKMNLDLSAVGGQLLVVSQLPCWLIPAPVGVPRLSGPPRLRRRANCTRISFPYAAPRA